MATHQPNKPDSGQQENKIQFQVAFDGTPDKPLEVKAYAFDRQGGLITSAPVKDGQVNLALSAEQLREARIFFGPVTLPEERGMKLTLDTMARLKAYEPVWKFEPQKRLYEFLPIPDFHWQWWYWCHCRVRGRVVKPVTIGGVTYDKPVCNARVHICEVDQLGWIIPRLPDDILWRLRDELLQVIERPRPIPIPDPPPFVFDPGVVDPSPENLARMNGAQAPKFPLGKFDVARARLNLQTELPLRQVKASSLETANEGRLSLQPLPLKERLTQFSVETHTALLSNSAPIVRQALLNNLVLIRPWLCVWDWIWPYFCTCDEVAVLTTDGQGRFDTYIGYQCFGDHPDLYFWVEYCIGGVWTTVYHPYSICCHTYWDYVCGSEVTLRITDPRVPWCGDEPPLPGKQIVVLSIGHEISMTEIKRQSAGAAEGLTPSVSLPGLDAPFGRSLEPHVFFGEGLIPSGITHYRWSYRRLGSTGDWTAIDNPVIRHYAEEKNDGTLTFKPFLLGPDPALLGQSLFKIKPKDAPPPSGAVLSTAWAPEVDARQNTASAFFHTHLLEGGNAAPGAGKYELKLELFKNVGGTMHVVNLSDDDIALKVPTVDAPFGQNVVPTQEVAHFPAQLSDMEDRVLRAANKIVAFRLVVHVDNNPCYAEIEDVSVNGQAAGPCGFVSYTPGSDAVVSFIARHPHDYATFSFQVNKGSSGGVAAASASGWVGQSSINGFTRDLVGLFTKNVPVAMLLGSCPKAAFSETLNVYALATDGWSRLAYLDRDAPSKAFALEPAPVTPPSA